MKKINFSWDGKKHTISENQCPLVIAEAGVNHNGNLMLAKKLVDAAKKVGADIVKFQTFHPQEMATPGGASPEYIKRESPQAKSFYNLLEKLTLPDEAFKELFKYCKKKDIIFLSAPYDNGSADLLDKIGVPMFKIASTDANNIPFIQYVAKKGKPMIISTGISTFKEAKQAIEACKRVGNQQVIIMQCTANYPASIEAANIKVISMYQKKLGVMVGYSDHTNGELCAILAVSQGAVIIEHHFTLNKNLPGPDQKASANPEEMKNYIASVQLSYKALGDGIKRIMPEESEAKKHMQKSLTSTRYIKKGEKIENRDILVRRPATGIPPIRLFNVIGKVAARDIKKDVPIKEVDIKW